MKNYRERANRIFKFLTDSMITASISVIALNCMIADVFYFLSFGALCLAIACQMRIVERFHEKLPVKEPPV